MLDRRAALGHEQNGPTYMVAIGDGGGFAKHTRGDEYSAAKCLNTQVHASEIGKLAQILNALRTYTALTLTQVI